MNFHDSFAIVGPASLLIHEWVRAPAGSFDPAFGDHVPADHTLIRMLPSVQTLLRAEPDDPTTGHWAMWQGIITWQYPFDPSVPMVDVPDPANGSFDWAWRHAEGGRLRSFTSTGALPTLILVDSLHASPPYTDVRSQRKLSQGTGILYVVNFTIFASADDLIVDHYVDVRYLEKAP